jgi:ubiquinone/menaquinone biosynthesis C-methylase UbiE
LSWREAYERRFYNQSAGWVDGTQEFHNLCALNISRGSRILELGAGPTNPTSTFLATLGALHGLDPDAAVERNTALRSASILTAERFPFSDASFDHCVSNYVAEHIENPLAHLSEVRRVLKPGGSYIFRTVNRFHYVGLIASISPHWFHRVVANYARALPRTAHDPYPTLYLLNSARAIRRMAASAFMDLEYLAFVEKDPQYGRFSRLAFIAFMLYERLVNSTEALRGVRANLFVVLRTPTSKATDWP